MRAVLRLQWMLLARRATSGEGVALAAYATCIFVVTAIVALQRGEATLVPLSLLTIPVVTFLFDATVGAARWARDGLPVTRAACAAAYVTAWTFMSIAIGLVGGALAAVSGRPAAETGAEVAVRAFAAAGFVPALGGRVAGRRLWMWIAGALVVCICPPWPALRTGPMECLLLVLVLAASVAIGVRAILRMELTPGPSPGTLPGSAPATRATPPVTAGMSGTAAAAEAPRGRPPAWTLLRSMSDAPLSIYWCVLALGLAAAPVPMDVMPFLVSFGGVLSISMCGLSGMRWALATPVDRGWAFRVLVGPAFALAVAIGAVRFVTLEVVGDRTAFFSSPSGRARETLRNPAHRTLIQGHLIEMRDNRYEPRDPTFMATRLSAHFREEYILDVPAERIEATIRRGWPGRPDPRDPGFALQEATFDALDRVHEDLASELRSADRRRTLVNVVAGVVLLCGVVRTNLCRRRRTKILLTILLWLPLLAMIAFAEISSMKGPAPLEPGTILGLLTSLQRLVLDGSPWRLVAYVAAAAAAVWALWRSSGRAFRRLDLTELPPVVGRGGR